MSENKVAWAISDNNVTVAYNGETHIVKRTDALADKLINALKTNMFDDIPNLVSASKRIENFSDGKFVVKDGEILIDGIVAPTVLGNKIVKFANEGLPYQPLVNFAENLQKNPSYRAVSELFQFLEKNDHPVTSNGGFIAYKKVREDFKDVHSGTFDNSVGKTVEMPRNKVNENPEQTCSAGLHVANYDYASNFYNGGIMLEVEVMPEDVVAIPVDYNQAKMRVCKYTVLGIVTSKPSEEPSLKVTNPNYFGSCYCVECDAPISSDEADTDGLCEDCYCEEDQF